MTTCTCPRCGNRHRCADDELDAQIAARVAAWEAECADRGYPIASGRVSEEHAAKLLGMAPRTLAGKRKARPSAGPRAHHLPVYGSRWSYSLTELAAWEAAHQEGESWI